MDYAYQLELLVRRICNCERLDFDGTVDAEYLASHPFDILQILGRCLPCAQADKRFQAINQIVNQYQSQNPKMTDKDPEYADFVNDIRKVVNP